MADINMPNDSRKHVLLNTFVVKLGVQLNDVPSQYDQQAGIIREFLKKIPQQPELELPNILLEGMDFRILGPIYFVWDHPGVKRKLQIQAVKDIYSFWFKSMSERSALPLSAVISYGQLCCWVPVDADRHEFVGIPLTCATKVGQDTIEENDLREPRILLSDDRASSLLFDDQPHKVLKTRECEDIMLQLRLPE